MSTIHNHAIRGEVTDWASRNGLIVELLPFAYRKYDPIQKLKALNNQFDEWPKTKATFSLSEVNEPMSNVFTNHELPLPVFAGAYKIHESNGVIRWTNPKYVHEHDFNAVTDQSRVEYAQWLGQTGLFSLRQLASRFDVGREKIRCEVSNNGNNWGEIRRNGRNRLAQTIETAAVWNGYSRREIAMLFNAPFSTVRDWVHYYASDYDVPVDPTR